MRMTLRVIALVLLGCSVALSGCPDGPLRSICGDGLTAATEECDDGNLIDWDGCSARCVSEGEHCSDGLDNNANDLADCADDACLAAPACAGLCATPIALADPVIYSGDTSGKSDIVRSSCQTFYEAGDGGDVTFTLTPRFEQLDVTLSSPSDHGVMLRTACEVENSEVACSDAYLAGFDESVTVRVTPLEPIYISVGAFEAGQEGPFTLTVSSRPVACGDGRHESGEQCDDGNSDDGDGCDSECQLELVCGDGFLVPATSGGTEECDDGNRDGADGCDDMCRAEAQDESEPNEDGVPEPGGVQEEGNDFSVPGVPQTLSSDGIIAAQLSPPGDEDVFRLANASSYDSSVRVDTFMRDRGIDRPCGFDIDTVVTLRAADGSVLARNDDRDPMADRCSGLDLVIGAGAEAFVHVIDYDDDDAIPTYFVRVAFAICGDGLREGLEGCDDGNNDDGDGCSRMCQEE